MPMLRVELPARPSGADLEALQADLKSFGNVEECPPVAFNAEGIALAVSLFFEAIQAIDVLVNWLSARIQSTPRVHQAVIRFPDGSRLELRTDNDQAFRAALKAVIKKL